MNSLNFRDGWDFMASVMGGDYSSNYAAIEFNSVADANVHIQQINDAVDQLAHNINYHEKINLDVDQFKGFVAEEMHAGTFNYDAIRDGSANRATVLHSQSYGSVDIGTNFGKDYGVKYMATPEKTATAQATFDRETGIPKYHNQERLSAADHVEEAKEVALRRVKANAAKRPEIADSYKETAEHLVDRIEDGEGHSSTPLTNKEAIKIAKEAKSKEGFDPTKHGIEKMDPVKIDYIKSGLKAGVTAATITAIMQLAPELYKGIDYLIKNGEINLDHINTAGAKIITTSGESFLRGTAAYTVEHAIKNGLLGEAAKEVSPTIVGLAVVVVMSTIRNSILVAAGKKTAAQMGVEFADTVVMSAGYFAGAKLGGAIAQVINPELPGLAYVLGTLVGCAVSAVYFVGKKQLISLCVDTGFTCFGLVDQNYELPDAILHELGINVIEVPETKINMIPVKSINVHRGLESKEPETIQMTLVKRGVVGVNKIGYVPA